MKVTLASYQTVTLRHGGPQTQIQQTKKYLEEAGVQVKLMDIWGDRETVLDSDLFHLFASNLGTYDLAGYLYAHEFKYVVSPIFFTRRSARTVRWVCAADSMLKNLANGLWTDYGFARDVCRWARQCLPNTTEERHLLVDGLGVSDERATVVPNGVEHRFLEGDPDLFYRKYGLKDFVLHVGHIGLKRKNTLSMIRALKDLDVPSVIIGRVFPSKEAEACLEEAEKNNDLLIIQGLDHESHLLASAYSACDVFALPAQYETPGIAALEAGLSGAKIVITPHGGTKDYFEDMAIYVDPYSVNSIRKGITKALEQNPSDQLKKHIQKHFLWKKVAEKTLEVYENVVSG